MLIKEFRIPLPLSVDEYKVAQLYMIAKKSKEETQGAGSGVEILVNEPYDEGPGGSGQYTHKIYHVGYHLPGWLKALLPKSALTVEEEAWNAYPYTKTRYTCPFVEKFFIEIETKYYNDCGNQENVFELSNSEVRSRVVDVIDIVKDQLYSSDYIREEDPKFYVSEKTGRGPLSDNWVDEHWNVLKNGNKGKNKCIMCAYKLCRVEFKYWGMQTKIEKFIHDSALRKTMVRAHKQAWSWQDEWVDLTMADIRKLEKETQEYLKNRMAVNNENANEVNAITQQINSQTISERQEIDLNVIDKDNEQYEEIIAMEVPKCKTITHPPLTIKHSKDQEDGKRKIWSRSSSKAGLLHYDYELQIANLRMESIVRNSDSSSDDEFYDAEEILNVSPITKWSSLEYIPSDLGPKEQQSIDAGDESDNIFSEAYIKRIQSEHSKHKTAFMNRNSVDTTSLPNSPTHTTPCPTDILIIILHGGSLLDAATDLNSNKTSDITTFRSSFEAVVRQHYPRLNGRIAFRLVSCPAICYDALVVLSSLSPYSFQASPSAIDGVYHTYDAIPIGALPVFAISSHEYYENVSKVISTTNHIYSEFLKSEEGLGFCGQVCLIGDSIGSVIGFDAMCRSNYLCSQYGSETSIPDLPDTQKMSDSHNKPVLTGHKNPLISISDGSGNEDVEENQEKTSKSKILFPKSNAIPVNRTYFKSHSHSGETTVVDESATHRLLTAPLPRRRSSCSSDQSCCHRLEFEINDFFMFGSPLGLVLTFRKMLSIDDKSCPLPKPSCSHIYNLFHPTDPSVLRLEPLLSARFSHIPPVNVSRYQKYPLGDGQPIHLLEYLQTYCHLFAPDTSPQVSHSYSTMGGRRTSEASISSNISMTFDSLTLPNITSLTQKWWGSKRLDYALYCPEGLNNFPTHALPHLFHASYWESNDVISFILRQISRSEYMSSNTMDTEKDVQCFTPCQPREKWQKKRTSVKLKVSRNITANHRANDVIVKEGATQVISARFMYGPLDVVALSGEKVDIHIMKNGRSGDWTYLATELTDKSGRLAYTIPDDKSFTLGLYPVKIVVRGDHTSIDFYMAVVPPKTECVVFSIDGSFTASMSVTGKDPKVRAGAVDIVRYWQELGYLIIYITGRPDMQQQKVISWLAQHNFPHGLVSFADRLSTDPLRHKAEHLRHLQNDAEIVFQAAYGSSKDISVYQSLGLKPEQINIVGKVSKKQHSMANILSEGYAIHLNELIAHGCSRPAQGNARMVLPRGGFGGVRHRRSTKAKRTISYPLTAQVSVPSIPPLNAIPNTAPTTSNFESVSYGFFNTKFTKQNK
ncbi:protein retinal degeneration B-like isoform X2 [Oppia nitens]|uniref:protein retinal degeneration B-like isoform X2 n=1 Tax=Oppia nitens TaxID=1686743 RepID=UPI0023DA7EF7|nr:protein retinal degeneration B-like isoform X2 [Oppia nitens]